MPLAPDFQWDHERPGRQRWHCGRIQAEPFFEGSDVPFVSKHVAWLGQGLSPVYQREVHIL